MQGYKSKIMNWFLKIGWRYYCCLFVTLGFAQSQPNILFIMSDDHTATAIGAYGGRLKDLNPTPTIDQLAKEGMLLENVFCNNSICSPSRANILTGQYSFTNGVTSLGGKVSKENQHLPIAMKAAGYETAVIGKWHLGELPLAFDYFKVLHSQGAYFNPMFTEPGLPVQKFKKGKKIEKGTTQMQGHSSDCIADSSIEWLKSRDQSKPFFLKMHFKAPHGPYDYATRYEDYLKNETIPEPENLRDRKNHGSIATRGYNDELIDVIGSSVSNRNIVRNQKKLLKKYTFKTKDTLGETYQYFLKKYLRCVKGIDDNINKVISYLKANNALENTIIIYTADQGYYLGEHDYFDKRWGYEEGMRMPFIIRYPKTISQGLVNNAIIENIDFAPTLIDLGGGTIPDLMQGKSFKSILNTGKTPKDWKKAAYYHYPLHMAHHYNPAHIGLRTEDYKLLFFYGASEKSDTPTTPPGWELYDLKKDPTEDVNVYNDPKYKTVIKRLKTDLKAIRKKYHFDSDQYPFNKIIEAYWDYNNTDYENAILISNKARAIIISNAEEKIKRKAMRANKNKT